MLMFRQWWDRPVRIAISRWVGLALGPVMMLAGVAVAHGVTIESALVQAYQNNPQLNAQRAQARVVDEGVPQALSGYRPTLNITSTLGEAYTTLTNKSSVGNTAVYTQQHATTTPWTVG